MGVSRVRRRQRSSIAPRRSGAALSSAAPCSRASVLGTTLKHNGVGYPVEHLRIHAHLYPAGYDHVGEIQFSQADLGTDD